MAEAKAEGADWIDAEEPRAADDVEGRADAMKATRVGIIVGFGASDVEVEGCSASPLSASMAMMSRLWGRGRRGEEASRPSTTKLACPRSNAAVAPDRSGESSPVVVL